MIDLHTHILPGLDDGAKTIEESIAMCRTASQDGIQTVVATPHIFTEGYHATPERIRSVSRELAEALRERNIKLDIRIGSEARLVEDLPERISAGDVAMLDPHCRFLLLEPPRLGDCGGFLCEAIFQLRLRGFFPIVVHPECTESFRLSPALAERVIEQGAWIQITADSLLAELACPRPDSVVANLLCNGHVHVIASDAHDPTHRPPLLSEARRACAGIMGEQQADLLVRGNPQRILDGEAAVALSPVPREVFDDRPDSVLTRIMGALARKTGAGRPGRRGGAGQPWSRAPRDPGTREA